MYLFSEWHLWNFIEWKIWWSVPSLALLFYNCFYCLFFYFIYTIDTYYLFLFPVESFYFVFLLCTPMLLSQNLLEIVNLLSAKVKYVHVCSSCQFKFMLHELHLRDYFSTCVVCLIGVALSRKKHAVACNLLHGKLSVILTNSLSVHCYGLLL